MLLLYLIYSLVPLPEIIRPVENTSVIFQQSISLYCLAGSYGVLTYNWKKENGLSSYASQSLIFGNYSDTNQETIMYQLTIPNAHLSDEGWYCCVATNEDGSTERCIWLDVKSECLHYCYHELQMCVL